MSTQFLVCAAPDHHIEFLSQHPGLVHDYLEGKAPPAASFAGTLPSWWPSEPLPRHDAWNVNYRNTELYHWILNGGPSAVSGSGAVFQTWHNPEHPSKAQNLDAHNERFALYAQELPELTNLVANVNLERVMTAFRDWLLSQGNVWAAENAVDQMACEPFVAEFQTFHALLVDAEQQRLGLIW